MNALDPQAALDRAEKTFDEVLAALEIPERHRLMLKASASSWAKARSDWATAYYLQSRRSNTDIGPN